MHGFFPPPFPPTSTPLHKNNHHPAAAVATATAYSYYPPNLRLVLCAPATNPIHPSHQHSVKKPFPSLSKTPSLSQLSISSATSTSSRTSKKTLTSSPASSRPVSISPSSFTYKKFPKDSCQKKKPGSTSVSEASDDETGSEGTESGSEDDDDDESESSSSDDDNADEEAMKRRNSDATTANNSIHYSDGMQQQQQGGFNQNSSQTSSLQSGKRMRVAGASGAMGYSVHHQQQQQNAFGGQQGMMHMGGAGDMMGFHGGFQGHQGFPDQSPQQQFMFAGNGGGMMGGNNGVGFPVMNQFSMMGNGNHQMNHPGMQSPMFGGSVMSMSSNTSSAVNMPTRTVYLGNIPAGTTYEDILNMVKFGPLESIKMIEEKSCCFLTFIEASSAMQFFNEYQGKRVLIGDQEIKFGWGKASICPQYIYNDVLNGSCRNVYIGQCDETVTEESLRTEFEPFGPIDQIRVIPDKHIAFVHLCSVAQAMKAVATLPNRPFFAGKKVNYGKDRCGNMLIGNSAPGNNPGHGNNMGGNSAMHLGGNNMGGAMGMGMGMNGMGGMGGMNPVAAAMGMMNNGMGMGLGMLGAGNVGGMGVGNALGGGFDPAAFAMMGNGGIPMNPQRTLYLGGLHPDATPKDICDVLRGGLVQKVNFLPEKNTAFVTFIDPMAAHALFVRGNNEGVVIKGKRVKIGWGKPAPVIPSTIFQALQQGATRNVYVGPLDASMDEDRLRTDFSEFGEIELINMVKDKNIGFVSFTDIASAIKVVENLQSSNPQYSSLRVAYGKDRCNNPLRPPRSQYLHHSQAGSEGGDSGFY